MNTSSPAFSLGESKYTDERQSSRLRLPIQIAVAFVALLFLPLAAFAQFPTPAYGWNLGNTMEPPSGEGTWGNPPVTQALINKVAASGFNTIRIPIAWNSHANQTTYQIDPVWMARVKQVVDWCLAANLTVVINSHWDGGWFDGHGNCSQFNPTLNAKFQSYWTQIANAFATYDSRLIFAAANEPDAQTQAETAELLKYYQTFVNAVRATGGNNATRWLVLPGPQTNHAKSYDWFHPLPTDSATGRLIVEVHYYEPYQYTLMDQDAAWGKMFYFWGADYHTSVSNLLDRNPNWNCEEAYMLGEFQKMQTKYTSKGVPVIVGEFCAIRRTNYSGLSGTELDRHLASRTYFNKKVLDYCVQTGCIPFYWDAGGTGQNGSAVIDRNTLAIVDQPSLTSLTGGPAVPPPGTNVTIPNAPSGLTATAASDIQINLTWADNSSNEANFELQRATNSTFTSGLVTTALAANTISHSATGLSGSTTYYFRVRATNSAGASAYSNTASATTQPPPPPPLAPSALAATVVSSSQINLSWADNASNETGFELQRATNSTFTSGLVTTTLAVNTTSHSATGLAASTTYYFRVRAFNSAGASSYSNTVGATTQVPPPESILQQNLTGGTRADVKGNGTVSQSFVHPGAGTYQVTKLTIHVSRGTTLPNANLVVSLGTAHGSGTIAGSTVNIAPATVTNTSGGSTYQTLDVAFASPVTLTKGTTYYINVVSATAGGRPYYIEIHGANTYSGGAFTGAGGGPRDMWFQVWGQ